MTGLSALDWQGFDWIGHTQILLNSFRRLLGRELIERGGGPEAEAWRLLDASFVVVSHGTQDDPVLNYGNRAALQLWETELPVFRSMPSRLTAEPMHRDERAELIARARNQGYADNYRGIRTSLTGKRFLIDGAIVWNLADDAGNRCGQAATFSDWTPLPSKVVSV